MKPKLYLLTGPWHGRIAILARPRGNEWLRDEVRDWRAEGINVVVGESPTEAIEHVTVSRGAPVPDNRAAELDICVGRQFEIST